MMGKIQKYENFEMNFSTNTMLFGCNGNTLAILDARCLMYSLNYSQK